MERDEVRVVETHIDDMNPELLGFLMERLLDEGALDVAFSPLQMKKNRPAVKLTVIAPPPLLDHLSRIILLESTAIGVRHYPAERLTLARHTESRETSLGPIRVKVLSEGGVVVRVAPEFEECRRLALERRLPLAEVYRIVQRETA
jgi:pyridinium-3,5-bisthiocarboxylic acid mononucleotide nickel chelatase